MQQLGDALDGLVRALTLKDVLAEGFARRAHELWLIEHGQPIAWLPTELRAGDRSVLAASAKAGRFVLPAYHAGLRAIALRRSSAHTDVLRFGQRLSALETGTLSPAELAAWLFAGCALGFDLALGPASHEIGPTLLELDPGEAASWGARYACAVAGFHDLVTDAEAAWPPAVRRERFERPIESLLARAAAGDLALSPEDGRALLGAVDDPAAWAAGELALIALRPALAAATSVHQLSIQLAELIETTSTAERDLIVLCTALGSAATRAHGEGLDFKLLGEALGRRLLRGGLAEQAFFALLESGEAGLIDAVLRELTMRAQHEPSAVQALTWLLRRFGPTELFTRVDLDAVGTKLGTALVVEALASGMPVPALLAVIEEMPLETALRALIAQPRLLPQAQALIERLVGEQPLASGPLLAELVQAGPAAARAVGSVLIAQRGGGIPRAQLQQAFAALMRCGLGATFVRPQWDARNLDSSVRLAALAALEADDVMIAEVLGGRMVAMFEPREIREALEELRWRQP